MFNPGDKLLFVLNAKKEMQWHAFKRVVDILYISSFSSGDMNTLHDDYEIRNWKHATLRNLDMLGHCNPIFAEHQSIIKVAPSILTLLPHAGGAHAILSGARTPKLIEELVAYTEASEIIESNILDISPESGFAPSVISIRAMAVDELSSLSESLGIKLITTPSAWLLINACGTLKEYLDSLKWEKNTSLNWPRREYDIEQFQFVDKESGATPVLEQRTNPITNQFTFFYCKDGRRALIDKDWGRVALISELGQQVMYYDERALILGVPAKLPLPRLFGRALALCSGKLPVVLNKSFGSFKHNSDKLLALYMAVPREIALLAAEKLNQTLIPTSFYSG